MDPITPPATPSVPSGDGSLLTTSGVFYSTTTGRINSVTSAINSEQATSFLKEGEAFVITEEGHITPWTHYFNLTTEEITEYTQEQKNNLQLIPAVGFEWNPQTGSWDDVRDLSMMKHDAIKSMKAFRDGKLNGGFTWDSTTFDSDETAQMRILGLYTSSNDNPGMFPVSWRLKDNSWRALSVEDSAGVWAGLQDHIQSCFVAYATHEYMINALEDGEDVLAYDFTGSGWPSV